MFAYCIGFQILIHFLEIVCLSLFLSLCSILTHCLWYFSDEDRQQQSGTISLDDAVSTTTTAAGVPARTSTPDTEVDEEFNFPPPEENQPIMVSENYIYVRLSCFLFKTCQK